MFYTDFKMIAAAPQTNQVDIRPRDLCDWGERKVDSEQRLCNELPPLTPSSSIGCAFRLAKVRADELSNCSRKKFSEKQVLSLGVKLN